MEGLRIHRWSVHSPQALKDLAYEVGFPRSCLHLDFRLQLMNQLSRPMAQGIRNYLARGNMLHTKSLSDATANRHALQWISIRIERNLPSNGIEF